MSNLLLTGYAASYAKDELERFIKDYNESNLTPLGRRVILEECIMFSFLAGAKFQRDYDATAVTEDCTGGEE